jgi:hypothetical protein
LIKRTVAQRLEWGCTEKKEERKESISKSPIGISSGVLIHSHSHLRTLLSRKAVTAMRVTRWIMLTAQPWTDPLASGVKMSSA